MMYYMTVIALAAVYVHAAPQQAIVAVSGAADSTVTPVPIVSQSESSSADGSFNYT